MSKTFIEDIRNKAKGRNLKVAFPDAEDIRTLKTVIFLKTEGIATPCLVGNDVNIKKLASENGLDLGNIEIYNPETSALAGKFTDLLYEKRKDKGLTTEQSAQAVKSPLYFAGLMLETDVVKVVVGGNLSSTGDVIRAAIHTVGVAPGISIVSSYFIMVFPERLLCFADCAVNPDPTDVQLADIAISSAKNFQAVTGEEPKVAMLSFSTKGSAVHPDVEKVQNATNFVREKAPLTCSSTARVQADAALIASIGESQRRVRLLQARQTCWYSPI